MAMGLYPDNEWKNNQAIYGGISLQQAFDIHNADDLNSKIRTTINVLKAQDIRGCITGSTILDEDFELWDSVPDIDVFVYSLSELVNTCAILQHKLGMSPGKGTERSHKQEEWKLEQLRKRGASKKMPVTTSSFFYDGVVVNATVKSHKGRVYDNIHEILGSFDMSIIMCGYDIHKHYTLDLRFGDPRVARPNLMRDMDAIMWNTAKWIRQFDRVVKYYSRGFDTRPMAEFYIFLIDECIDAGCLFDSESSKDLYNGFVAEFAEQRKRIESWLESHKED